MLYRSSGLLQVNTCEVLKTELLHNKYPINICHHSHIMSVKIHFRLNEEQKLHDIKRLQYILFQMLNKVLKLKTLSLAIKHHIIPTSGKLEI